MHPAGRLLPTERPLTVLRVSLHHPPGHLPAFAHVPPRLRHDISPLLVGRGQDAQLRLQLPGVSRRHLSLEPYREEGGTHLAFCLKVLSHRGCVWVNGLMLRYLEQVPLSPVSCVAFSGVQMVVRIEGGASLVALVCCFHLSPSPLIYRPEAEENDEWESIPQEQPHRPPGAQAPGHLGPLQGSSPTWDSSLQPSPAGGAKILLQREPQDGVLC